MDSTSALDLPDLPRRLLVVGGGYIGLELGTVYAALGSKVTVVEMTGELLQGVDRDLVRPLEERLERLFATNYKSTRVVRLEAEKTGVRVHLEGAGVDSPQLFDRALVAVGRRPPHGGARIRAGWRRTSTRRASFVSTASLRTTERRILAIGDVAGEPMLAHKATREGKVAAEVAAGQPTEFDSRAIPAVVFTDPEVAWCGLTETQAQAENRKVEVRRFRWSASGRAHTLAAHRGTHQADLRWRNGAGPGDGRGGAGSG